MSLDVYLTMPPDVERIAEAKSRIFIRDCGSTVEISREEWDRRFPGKEPFSVMMDEAEPTECYSANITDNLAKMAPNGWGLYEHFVPWVARYLQACEEYPNADVSVSR